MVGGQASINPATGAEEFSLPPTRLNLNGEQKSVGPRNSQNSRDQPGEQVALNSLERMFVTKEIEGNVRGALNRLTGGELSQQEQNDLYKNVLKNVNLKDAMTFQTIDPSMSPMQLNQQQCDIVKGEVGKLKGPLGSRSNELFQNALRSGRVICP